MNSEGVRVELGRALEGHHITVDVDNLTFGFLEDLESGKVGLILEALAGVIIESDLPNGHDRAGLRLLKLTQIGPVLEGIKGSAQVPKAP